MSYGNPFISAWVIFGRKIKMIVTLVQDGYFSNRFVFATSPVYSYRSKSFLGETHRIVNCRGFRCWPISPLYHPIASTRKSYPVKEQWAVEADVTDTLQPSDGCVAPSLWYGVTNNVTPFVEENAIGNVICSWFFPVDTHCLYGQQYPCDRAFPSSGISLLRFVIRGNHNCIFCTLRPVRASHKSGEISRPHGHHSSHSIWDSQRQGEALSYTV